MNLKCPLSLKPTTVPWQGCYLHNPKMYQTGRNIYHIKRLLVLHGSVPNAKVYKRAEKQSEAKADSFLSSLVI